MPSSLRTWTELESAIVKHEREWSERLHLKSFSAAKATQFYEISDKRCALLIHGFNSSPTEMEWVRVPLHRQGWSTVSITLPGFVGDPVESNKVTAEDWLQAVSVIADDIRQCFPSFLLAGHSLGATLALKYAERRSPHGLRLLLLAPYLGAKNKRDEVALLVLGKLFKSLPYKTLFKLGRNPDLKALIAKPEIYGESFPLRSVRQVIQLAKAFDVKQKLDHVQAQILISRSDRTIDAARVLELVRHNPHFNLNELPATLSHQFLDSSGVVPEPVFAVIEKIVGGAGFGRTNS